MKLKSAAFTASAVLFLLGAQNSFARELRDDFDRSVLGNAWTGFGWDVSDGQLHTNLGGSGRVLTVQSIGQTRYILRTSVRGLDSGGGPSPGDRVAFIFGAQPDGVTEYRVSFYLSFGQRVGLSRRFLKANGEIGEEELASAPVTFNTAVWYRLVVTHDGSTGAMALFLAADGAPFETPLLRATDTHIGSLGKIGWVIERESPPSVSDTFVDNVSAKAF